MPQDFTYYHLFYLRTSINHLNVDCSLCWTSLIFSVFMLLLLLHILKPYSFFSNFFLVILSLSLCFCSSFFGIWWCGLNGVNVYWLHLFQGEISWFLCLCIFFVSEKINHTLSYSKNNIKKIIFPRSRWKINWRGGRKKGRMAVETNIRWHCNSCGLSVVSVHGYDRWIKTDLAFYIIDNLRCLCFQSCRWEFDAAVCITFTREGSIV